MIGAELARLLGVSPQNVAGLVARLTQRQLLERSGNERHAHVLELRLTRAGEHVVARGPTVWWQPSEDDVVSVLGTEPAEDLKSALEALRVSLRVD